MKNFKELNTINVLLLVIIGFGLVESIRRFTYDFTSILINLIITFAILLVYGIIVCVLKKYGRTIIFKPSLEFKRKNRLTENYKWFKDFSPVLVSSIIFVCFLFEKIDLGNGSSIAQNQSVEFIKNNSLLTSIVKIGIKTPIIEEILYRGIIYVIVLILVSKILFYVLRNNSEVVTYIVSSIVYIMVSSFLFAFGHVTKIHWYNPLEWNEYSIQWDLLVGYIFTGIVTAIVFLSIQNKIKALLMTIVYHACTNITSTILVKYEFGNFIQFIVVIIFGILCVAVACIFIYNKKDYEKLKEILKDKEMSS